MAYEPDAHSAAAPATVEIRAARATDARDLATVMASRGGTVDGRFGAAERLIERLPILLLAEKEGAAVGWCGIQKYPIRRDVDPQWLVAGLTVMPDQRRQGIAAQLLRAVLRATADAAPGEPAFSVINAATLASIDLHTGLGFIEVARAASFAGIDFTGGEGVLLRRP